MPLTGRIDYTSILIPAPGGGWAVIGEDGNHYSLQNGGRLGKAETGTIPETITSAEFLADLQFYAPTFTGIIDYFFLPVPGTPYFGFIGGNFGNQIGLVFYKIAADGSVSRNSGCQYQCAGSLFSLNAFGDYGRIGGVTVVGLEVFFTLNCRLSGGLGAALVRVPYTVTEIDTNSGSWSLKCTDVHDGVHWPSGPNYSNPHALQLINETTHRMGIYTYVKAYDGVPRLDYIEVDWDAHEVADLTDVSTFFGIPFSDVGFQLDGDAGTLDDDYTAPTIQGTEFLWARPNNDSSSLAELQRTRIRRHEVIGTPTAETVTDLGYVDVSGWTITAINIRLLNSMVYREGDDLLLTMTDRRWVYFNQINLPLEQVESAIGGSGMQLEALGCVLSVQLFNLAENGYVRDLHSIIELGPFRFVEQKESDETSMVTTLILGLTEVDIGLVVYVDMDVEEDITIDMATLVDVLGDDIFIDMGEGTGNSDDFTLELLGNDDGSTYPGAPIEFKPEQLEVIEDRGSTKQYSPTGYSYIYHRVRLKATEIDEKFAVKFVDISGQLTGRLK
jgi:hypothetical protein